MRCLDEKVWFAFLNILKGFLCLEIKTLKTLRSLKKFKLRSAIVHTKSIFLSRLVKIVQFKELKM